MTDVRLGGLFQHSVSKFGRMAAFVMAIGEINNSTSLLPDAQLRFAVKDSACDAGSAIVGAHELAQASFAGLGSHGIIGAACSDASKAAAAYLQTFAIPQISPSSTSSTLSDSTVYPYFARTPPSDAWQSFALADLVEYLLGVERVATVNSEDSYGAAGMQEFLNEAARRSLTVQASTSFGNGQVDFSLSVDVLQRSGALVVVLFCQAADASNFIKATQAAGLSVTFVGSEAVTSAVSSMVTSSSEQTSLLRGFAGLSPSSGVADEFAGFQARLQAFQATVLGESWCSDATDDDGYHLWRTADGSCRWAGGDASADFYAPLCVRLELAARGLHSRLWPTCPGWGDTRN